MYIIINPIIKHRINKFIPYERCRLVHLNINRKRYYHPNTGRLDSICNDCYDNMYNISESMDKV